MLAILIKINMQVVQAKTAKNLFWSIINDAQHEPLSIERYWKSVAVILSRREYDKMKAIEDMAWWLQANNSSSEWFIWNKKSEDLLDTLLNA